MKKLAFLLVGTAMAVSAAQAEDVVAIEAGQLLDKPGNAPRGAATIIVRDGKVSEIRAGHGIAPAGARLVDLRDKFVLPGLIDSHVHLDSGDEQRCRDRLPCSGQCQKDADGGRHHGT